MPITGDCLNQFWFSPNDMEKVCAVNKGQKKATKVICILAFGARKFRRNPMLSNGTMTTVVKYGHVLWSNLLPGGITSYNYKSTF